MDYHSAVGVLALQAKKNIELASEYIVIIQQNIDIPLQCKPANKEAVSGLVPQKRCISHRVCYLEDQWEGTEHYWL